MILNQHGINAQGNGLAPDEVLIGGHIYHTIDVGGFTWIVENLQYEFSGLDVSTADAPITGEPTTPTAWYYDNDKDTYGLDGPKPCGLLYNWYAANYLNTHKDELCPGWHVPALDELTAFRTAVGASHGDTLKAIDGDTWPTGWNGTNTTGLSILPAGRYSNAFALLGTDARFWSSSEYSALAASDLRLSTGSTITITTNQKTVGNSLRLIKDAV